MDILHKTCSVCGKKFDTPRSNPRKTCSPECAFAVRSKAHKGAVSKNRIDVAGKTYGELTAIRYVGDRRWLWRCSCGKEVEIALKNVRNGKTTSCGHTRTEKATERRSESMGDYQGTRISILKSSSSGKTRSNNTSGCTGVIVRHNVGMDVFIARITVQGKTINLGAYRSYDDAVYVRKQAEAKHFGKLITEYEESAKVKN